MALTPEDEKQLREEIRKQLEERERRIRESKEKEEEERRKRLEERLRARIKEEEEEKFYAERGYVKYINHHGEVEWLTPDEVQRRQSRKRSKTTSTRRRKHKRKKILRWVVNVGIIGIALGVFGAIYKYNPHTNKIYGSILVKTNVPGAHIFFDGNALKSFTPDTLSHIPAGNHYLSVHREGFTPWPPMRRISVRGNKITTAYFELKNTTILGKVILETNLPDFKTYVDGIPYSAQNGSSIEVPLGFHVFTVIKPGYIATPMYKRVLIQKHEVKKLSFRFVPSTDIAYLRVSSNLARGYVYLDGRFTGMQGSGELLPIPAGNYKIRLRENGYRTEPAMRSINILPGDKRTVVFYMEPLARTEPLQIVTRSPGASIVVDGQWLPFVTPILDLRLSPGDHYINLMREDKVYAERDIYVDLHTLKNRRLTIEF